MVILINSFNIVESPYNKRANISVMCTSNSITLSQVSIDRENVVLYTACASFYVLATTNNQLFIYSAKTTGLVFLSLISNLLIDKKWHCF